MHYVKDLPFRKKIRMYLAEKNLFIIIVYLQCLKQKKTRNAFLPPELFISARTRATDYLKKS